MYQIPVTQQAPKPSFLCYLLAFSVYSKELCGIYIGASAVDLFQLGLAGYGLVFYGLGSGFALRVGAVGACLLASSYFILDSYGHETQILVRQGLAAALIYAGLAGLLARVQPDLLIRAYLRISFWVAALGILQFVLSLGGIMIFHMMKAGRLDSIALEPSHYAIAIGPAVFLSLRTLLKEKRIYSIPDLVIVASILLTVSLTGLFIILFSLSLIYFRKSGIFFFLVFAAASWFIYTTPGLLPETISKRIEALEEAAQPEVSAFEITNLSAFSALTNWEVALDSVWTKGRILGNGFGGHSYAYADYVGTLQIDLGDREQFNAVAGHSWFIRIFSEFGIPGLVLYCLWLIKGTLAANNPARVWWALSAVFVFGRVFKLGSFIEIGSPIFILAPLLYHGWKAQPEQMPSHQPGTPHQTYPASSPYGSPRPGYPAS